MRFLYQISLFVFALLTLSSEANAVGPYRSAKGMAELAEEKAKEALQNDLKLVTKKERGEFCGLHDAEFYVIEVQVKETVRSINDNGEVVPKTQFRTVKTYGIPTAELRDQGSKPMASDECME